MMTHLTTETFAVVDTSAILGPDCIVWHFATICAYVTLGDRCVVGSCAWIGDYAEIGSDVRIQHGAFIPRRTKIGNRVFIGPMVIMCDDKYPRVNNKDYEASPPVIADDVSIGAGAVILPGISIGIGAMIGAGAVVSHDVADMAKVVGIPARDIMLQRDGKICAHCNERKPIAEFLPLTRGKYLQSWCRWCRNHNPVDPVKKKAKTRRYWNKLKREVLFGYSNGRVMCACCGEDRIEFLSLDHIYEDGASHRKSLGSDTGTTQVYQWARKNSFPPGLQVLCHNCNIAKYHGCGICPHQSRGIPAK